MRPAESRQRSSSHGVAALPAKWWEALLITFGIYLVSQIGATVVTLVVTGPPEITGTDVMLEPVQLVWIATVSAVVGLIILFCYVALRGKRSPFSALGVGKINPKPALKTFAIGLVAVAVLEVLLRVAAPAEWIPPHPFTETAQHGTATGVALVFVTGVVLVPLFEEALFRGYLFGALSQRLGFIWAALISSALFGLLHPSPILIAFAFFVGLLCCWAYKKSGNLWVPIALHIVVNATALAAAVGAFS